MSDRTLSQELARFAVGTSFADLPKAVVDSVEDRFLDTLGICLAASEQGTADGIAEIVEHAGGREEAGLIGRAGRFPATQAALHNGTLAHSLDFDDTHLPSVLHPSASVLPAALAVAEATGASGAELIAAAAVGIEVTVRTGMAGYLPGEGNVFFDRGWHATSICGTLGAAVAAAKLYGLDAAAIAHALGIGTSMGAGIIEANRTGGTVKRIHCGWAAHAGITAAQMAAHGMTGPPTAFEGRFGFYQAFLGGHYDAKELVDGLGVSWATPSIYFKPYPANHYTHAAIDAALAIRARPGFDIEQIQRIELGSSAAALRTIGEPRQEKIKPESGHHAKFSGPFVVASALCGGGGLGLYFDDFTDAKAKDPERLAIAAKVHTFVDPECDRVFPNAFAGVLRVHYRDGRIDEERVMANRGGPARPLSSQELRQKFSLNARGRLSPGQRERLAETVYALHESAGVEDLVAQVAALPVAI